MFHASRNPYDLTYVSSVLLDDETRIRDQLFDSLVSAQAMLDNAYTINASPNSINVVFYFLAPI